jgi:hypothetical protein
MKLGTLFKAYSVTVNVRYKLNETKETRSHVFYGQLRKRAEYHVGTVTVRYTIAIICVA